ncbi:MAG: hypothetical protein V5783_12120 [Pontiella sp.]
MLEFWIPMALRFAVATSIWNWDPFIADPLHSNALVPQLVN